MGKSPKRLQQSEYKLQIVEDLSMLLPNETSTQAKRFAKFKCPTCEQPFKTQVALVKSGHTTKCRSCATRLKSTTHGDSGTRLHTIWNNMRARCGKQEGYLNITVCEEWTKSYSIFKEWSMVTGYVEELTIDRINNEGNYEPSNCRWVDMTVQAQNRRVLKSTNTSGYRGVSKHHGIYEAYIQVSGNKIYLGSSKDPKIAAGYYDKYVTENNLEHNHNGVLNEKHILELPKML
jgi:ribosomal protein S27E